MYNPCFDCWNRYDRQYTKECDNICEYAQAINKLNKLKPYGSIDDIVAVMNGDRFPLVFVNEKNIDSTYRIVCAAKEGVI